MRNFSILLILASALSLFGCGSGGEINGRNSSTAFRSVKMIKERLPQEKRIQFEVSFWTIRDANKDESAFLDAVDGKNPDEIIMLGKEIYDQRKSQGFKEYEQYSSWEDMISKFGQERMNQDRTIKVDPRDRDKTNDVLYKL
ncbi:MAG: hypothetical protein Q7U98_13320 [Methylicorpusculum sp.]|uniref:hypothetical protein n=1 Tax=Methylicorpusculum sp. TaxID=2713644 RepID=UPI002720260F|nr:hypothetical protein [Methylicorpusculum sp.]MDO8940126.1 hypothetical protein [Methylicorpusculum sp.]MDO9238529.1 hypothetical protein [Methylicorpusculum sp.]MDP2179679.1 hypothetical protein [Methylicorpusculum sp.]MDP2200726.1 hypothetical protein [Methylicorpusculum sp.]MDP3528077.1 hypothetical protein [Methylicorpusculum sp.]